MATYKVAQDVEAEDKLLGPFSFRQFIYLIIAAMAGVLAWGLSQLFAPLFIIPTPVIIFFLILALPLRKDQPMEIYLAAIVSFYVKPRRRLWQPDGVEALIEVTAPRETERILTKGISSDEADRRLAYLASIADTKGWSVRNIAEPAGTSMSSEFYNEAQNYEDMFDSGGKVAQSFGSMIDQSDTSRRQHLIESLSQPAAAPQVVTPETSVFAAPQPQPQAPQAYTAPLVTPPAPQAAATVDSVPQFDPYPTNMRQHVLTPAAQIATNPAPTQLPDQQYQPQQTPPDPTPQPAQLPAQGPNPVQDIPEPAKTTSDTPVSPDIISLANNHDLSIETIAREAHRLEAKHKKDDDQEVVISLR